MIFNNIHYSVVDVTLIRAFVDLGFDGMSPQERLPTKVGSAQYS